jgi:acyl carrier protein
VITDIRHRVRAFMRDEFKESGFHDGIGDDASLIEASVLDSLSILKLISFMDDEFGVIPSDDELNPERLASINLIAELIARKSKPGI